MAKKTNKYFLAISAFNSASALRDAGYSASALRDAGYSASALRDAGYSASALRDAGYSASDMEEWDSIPVISNPYTSMLSDINSKKRIHNQSDWGAITDFDPNANVCGTPMCTAGMLVNMAGKIGYDIKKKYNDWRIAATLIHLKTHPDYPIQNFGAIEQSKALSYIEVMSEIETLEATGVPAKEAVSKIIGKALAK